MKNVLICFCFILLSLSLSAQNKYQQDFDYFWNTVRDFYAYFDQKQTDWNKVKEVYANRLKSIKEDWEFLYMIELMTHELYDPHFTLNRNLQFSFRLIPNDVDAHIELIENKYIITDIREGYLIEDVDVKIGDEFVAMNDQEITDVIKWNLPASINNPNKKVKEYFANSIFAGRHNKPRKVKIKRDNKFITIELPKPIPKKRTDDLISFKILKGNIGYIKMNNSLGNNKVIKLFPKVVDSLRNTKAILLDLRETHGGGNAEVAKSIMGKFITKERPYQIHERVSLEREYHIKRRFIELVSPLKDPFLKPVYVLVSHWTGSIGEAIAQGFSNFENATVVGTPMAKLLGAINCNELVNSGIRFCYPIEKLYNIDGTPREDFVPDVVSKNYKHTLIKSLELVYEKK